MFSSYNFDFSFNRVMIVGLRFYDVPFSRSFTFVGNSSSTVIMGDKLMFME